MKTLQMWISQCVDVRTEVEHVLSSDEVDRFSVCNTRSHSREVLQRTCATLLCHIQIGGWREALETFRFKPSQKLTPNLFHLWRSFFVARMDDEVVMRTVAGSDFFWSTLQGWAVCAHGGRSRKIWKSSTMRTEPMLFCGLIFCVFRLVYFLRRTKIIHHARGSACGQTGGETGGTDTRKIQQIGVDCAPVSCAACRSNVSDGLVMTCPLTIYLTFETTTLQFLLMLRWHGSPKSHDWGIICGCFFV